MKITKIEAGHYEAFTSSGVRLVIFQVRAQHNQYGQRRKNPRAGNPWRVRDPRVEGPMSIVAEEWTFAAAKEAAERYAERSTR
jgi:hypothetical protein